MPKFKITTSMSSVNYDYYEVEASTEEEAINLIMSGEADAYDSEVETDANSLEIVDVNIEDQDYTTPSHIFISIKEYKFKTIKR